MGRIVQVVLCLSRQYRFLMRYRETPEKSAENLRLALAHMGRQKAAFHPISYAVWYEHVAGINRQLSEAINLLQASHQVLDEESTQHLYLTYIAEGDTRAARDISTGIDQVLTAMSDSAAAAGDEANRFGTSLATWVEEGSDTNDAQRMLLDTQQMQSAIQSLSERLQESRQEVDRLKQEVSHAREDALSDGLTGLANRKGFDLALADCLTELGPDVRGPSLLIGDIDHFKRVNDTYGHLFGDRVLQTVAKILKATIKGADVAARFGGEEFIILLPNTRLEDAERLAEKIRNTVAQSRIRRQGSDESIESVTISLGVTSYHAGESASELIARADRALYASKTAGRNRVSLF